MEATLNAPTLELLAWISERPRSYADTMDAWTSHCPRLTIWEDAIAAGLVEIARGNVSLSAAGRAAHEASTSYPGVVTI